MGWFGKKMNAYKGSKRDGPWELYHEDGALSWRGNFRAGALHGPWAAHYENGQLQQTGTYSGGELDGPYETYDENGQLRFKGTYNMGERCGEWIQDGETVTYGPCPPGPDGGN